MREDAFELVLYVLRESLRNRRGQRRGSKAPVDRFLLVGIAFELAPAVALVYVPGLNRVFHQAPIPAWWWLTLVVWAPVVFFAKEVRKAVLRRRQTQLPTGPEF